MKNKLCIISMIILIIGCTTFKDDDTGDTTAPANVTNFTAIAGDAEATLSWQNLPIQILVKYKSHTIKYL